jgi:type VI secretion system secreted protein VgrG
MEITTPLGPDVLLFHRMQASEHLSRASEYRLDLLSSKGDINLDEILGKAVTVKLELPDGGGRHFNGYVTRFGQVGSLGRYNLYQATVRPWLWFLTRTATCRIFQNMKVPDIIKQVFDAHGVASYKMQLSGNYRNWEYCVQYRETDFNFVSRLMEQEGMYYYFAHTQGTHTLVVVDAFSAHEAVSGYESISFLPQGKAMRLEQEVVRDWDFAREIQPGMYVLDEFDFKKPSVDLKVNHNIPRNHELAKYEIFDYPGEYVEKSDGQSYVQTRIEELQSAFETARGSTNARGVTVGSTFKLTGHGRKDQNAEYLVSGATTLLEYSEYETMESPGANYNCSFSVVKVGDNTQFRPERVTPKPIVQGPQTAIVVGPSGDEIHTDEYGRVKVQFHWDRLGKSDENSSCWMRVSHPWAGKNWGMVAIPRIGQEVIVDFLEGDPDQPLITGRVYNAEQMPPYELPANKTQTGVKTRSSTGGSPANFNEIRFEDKKGEEQLFIHAEKNQDISVENDETHSVGHDRTKTIDNDETSHIKHDRTETVDNNETITIGVDRTEKVGNNETITIGVNRTESVGANESITIGANRTISVGASETATVALQRTHAVGVNESIAIGAAQEIAIGAAQVVAIGADQSVKIGANQSEEVGSNQTSKVGSNRSAEVGSDDNLKVGKNLVIDAGDSVTIKTGSASISMKKDGTITIKGKDITVDGSGKINVKAGGDIVMKGSKILQN